MKLVGVVGWEELAEAAWKSPRENPSLLLALPTIQYFTYIFLFLRLEKTFTTFFLCSMKNAMIICYKIFTFSKVI